MSGNVKYKLTVKLSLCWLYVNRLQQVCIERVTGEINKEKSGEENFDLRLFGERNTGNKQTNKIIVKEMKCLLYVT